MSTTTIRPRQPNQDDATLVDMLNRLTPEFPSRSVEVFRDGRDNWPEDQLHEDWVAERDGRVVGQSVLREAKASEPGGFFGIVAVDPDFQRQGNGSRLYDHLLERARAAGANRMYTEIMESHPEALEFAEHRGFERTGKGELLSRLEVAKANLEGFEGEEERLRAEGIRIASMAELGPSEPLLRALYELDVETHRDIPMSEQWEEGSFEHWKSRTVQGQGRSPEMWWVALDGDKPVGVARLMRYTENTALNAYTGVARAYRGRGIARALKLRTIEWSRANGIEYHLTGNEGENKPMLSINIRLGYQMLPKSIELRKTLDLRL